LYFFLFIFFLTFIEPTSSNDENIHKAPVEEDEIEISVHEVIQIL